MPQLHTKAQEIIYFDILKWVQLDIIQNNKDTIILMGGDFQGTPAQENERLHYPPLTHFCHTTTLTHLTRKDIYTYLPAKSHIDHWLLKQPKDILHYTAQHTTITTHTLECGDHKALTLELP